MHSVLALKLGVTEVVIRAVLIVGRKPRVDWTFLRTYSLQKLFFKPLVSSLSLFHWFLFKLLSYSLLFLNFRWLVLTAQPRKALDVSPLLPESQLDSPRYVPQGEDSFEIVVTVPVGEDTQEAQ
jgi:hypothetical protein